MRDGFLAVADDLMFNTGRGVGGELCTNILDALVCRILFRIDDEVRIFAGTRGSASRRSWALPPGAPKSA